MIVTSTSINAIPAEVVRTAVNGPKLSYTRQVLPNHDIYTFAWWAELNGSLGYGQSRVQDWSSSLGNTYSSNITQDPPFTLLGYGYKDGPTGVANFYTVTVTRNASSTLDATICADELYYRATEANGTVPDEVQALGSLKGLYKLTEWVGDPCQPTPWDELTCADDPGNFDYQRVTSLNLTGRNLTGRIPASILMSLTSLTSLTLKNNRFLGPIPDLTSLLFLKVLDLADNELSGSLYTWMQTLETLNVSNNQLDGSFPSILLSLPGFSYSGNPLLECSPVGGDQCPLVPAPPVASPPSPVPPSETSPGSSSLGLIAGGIGGAVLLVAIVTGVATYIWCTKFREPDKSVAGATNAGTDLVGLGEGSVSFTLEDVTKATQNYARQIGTGGFGPVYYGVLGPPQNQEVAVKILSGQSRQGPTEFFNEIAMLSTIHHRNLVSLVGYCHNPPDLVLLYEYMSGGDLGQRLYGTKSSPPLTWLQRLNIAWDAAKGLQYLHDGCKRAIIHRDLKASNILLTHKLEALLADFGLSKWSKDGDTGMELATRVQGTPGYLDPEYNYTGLLTMKSDIYSFGVVLMEVLCGRPAFAPEGAVVSQPQDSYIVHRVQSAVKTGNVERVMDPAVGNSYSVESVWILADIAVRCTHNSSSARPNIQLIVSELAKAFNKESLHSMSSGGTSSLSYDSMPTQVTFFDSSLP